MLAMLDDPKLQSWYPAGLFAIAVGSLAFALHAQFFLGLEPCNLCLYQRIPYALIGLFAGAALVKSNPRTRWAVVWLAFFAFAAGAAVAFYHVGVEQHWWASAVCGGKTADLTSTTELLAGLGTPPEKSCDSVDWVFLGLSMATYNAAFSAVMAGLCFVAARRMRAA